MEEQIRTDLRMNCTAAIVNQNGAFTKPNITAEEMQSFVKSKMKEMGFVMGLFAGMFSKQIPKLQRWNRPN